MDNFYIFVSSSSSKQANLKSSFFGGISLVPKLLNFLKIAHYECRKSSRTQLENPRTLTNCREGFCLEIQYGGGWTRTANKILMSACAYVQVRRLCTNVWLVEVQPYLLYTISRPYLPSCPTSR